MNHPVVYLTLHIHYRIRDGRLGFSREKDDGETPINTLDSTVATVTESELGELLARIVLPILGKSLAPDTLIQHNENLVRRMLRDIKS